MGSSMMKILGISCVLALAANAAAQEPGKVALVMGYPSSVGVVWHVTDRVAIRPELSLSTQSTTTPLSVGDSSSIGIGLSGLFYIEQWENLRAYISPRFVFTRNTVSGTTTVTGEALNIYSVSGSFGSQYALGERFSVFGEVGLNYTRQRFDAGTLTIPLTLFTSDLHSTSWSTRTAVGVLFYF